MKYPEHIYDPSRLEMAEQLIEKELAKLLKDKSNLAASSLIRNWRERPSEYHLENGTRDFWDIFAAMIESIKLKPGFSAYLTADNYHWRRETISVGPIQMSSYLDTLKNIPGLIWQTETSIEHIMAAIDTPKVLTEQRNNSDQHSDDSQNSYPIFVRRTSHGSVRVMDGNRRALRAALYDKQVIDAWVADTGEDLTPRNYWVPVNDMMQLVKLFNLAETDTQRQSVRDSIEIIFKQTDLGRMIYHDRVIEMKGAKELIGLEPTSIR